MTHFTRTLAALLAMAVSSHAYAQSNNVEPSVSPPDRDSAQGEPEAETLFGGKPKFGGFGGPEVKVTPMLGSTSALVGGHGGMILNHVLVIGGAGYGLASSVDVPETVQEPGASRRLNFGYGGARVAWLIAPRSVVHGAFTTLIGGGGANWEIDAETEDTRSDAFFVLEPALEVEVNLHRLVRLAVNGSYRLVSGVDTPGFENGDFDGVAFGMAARFGVF
jgi:hypothetical protein